MTIEILSTTTTQEKLLRIEVQVGGSRRARTAEPILETAICGDPPPYLEFVQECDCRLCWGDDVGMTRCIRNFSGAPLSR